ncbi:MAG: pyruvate formate lyase family protein [Oscillospiraceae bacterium]|nr:pyruvate formate lyase family protein [Oscillospiraceae bacterium]
MYQFKPVTARVAALRERYRTAPVILDSEHARLVTEAYQKYSHDVAILKRAKMLYYVCENRTLRVEDQELIVGNLGLNYRGTSVSPDYGMGWLIDELDTGLFDKRDKQLEHMELSEEDRKVFREIWPFWKENSASTFVDKAIPPIFADVLAGGVLSYREKGNADMPTGHFNANYKKLVDRGLSSIRREAQEKLDAMMGKIGANDPPKFFFYQAVIICCDAMILLAKRYAAACLEKAQTAEGNRKEELLMMADSLNRIMEQPCRTFHDAVQACYLYQIVLALDGSLHGISFGRFDQYCWPYLKADLKEGRITEDEAQELIDCFFLKISDMFKGRSHHVSMGGGGYTSGQQMSLGGVDSQGNDATNPLSYMLLEASARLKLHTPPLSLRVHKNTPEKLWEAATECTKQVGGIPTFQNDDVIIPMMVESGYSLEDARDYCIIGCVEPAGSGNDFPACGGPHAKCYINMANCLIVALNDGVNPTNGIQSGPHTGKLSEMTDFSQVLDAFRKQVDYYMDWKISLTNMMEFITQNVMPLPVLSVTLDGCMESGIDCTSGGAKYNGCGSASVGTGTVGNSLAAIKWAVFDEKICTAREFHEAWMAGWVGHEELRQTLIHKAPHYGNGEEWVDELASWAMEVYAQKYNSGEFRRGHMKAGLFSVSGHIPMGKSTMATPDGRLGGTPLSDGISPSQATDKFGPIPILQAASKLKQSHDYNGTLLNMKFHPKSVEGDEGREKLIRLVQTYFEQGGMHIQYNVIGSDTLRDAQKHPDQYRDLVIRIAGFSAYFVELYKELQDDLISRTDQQ